MESMLSFTHISRRRRNILLACCALGAGGYVSYRVYTSPSVTRRRRQLYRFFHCISSLLEATAQGSDCVGLVWKDLHSFLLSSKDEVPTSLKQLFKVGQTREFQTSVSLLCKSMTQGIISSFPEQSLALHESDYGSALFEELSSSKEGLRKTGNAGRDLGYRESRDVRQRRWRSSEEFDGSQLKETSEEYYNYRRGKLERSGSASRIYGEEDGRRSKDEDDAGRYSSWKNTRSSHREKGSWCGSRGKVEGRAEGLPERLVGKLFSESGKGFASVVVASATRSLVLSLLQGTQEMNKADSTLKGETYFTGAGKEETLKKPASSASLSSLQPDVIDFVCSSKGKSLVADCIETFVGTAVSIYLDKTREVNVYEDMLSTFSKSEHRDVVKELLTSLCNGAVETLVRTSHEVISVGSSGQHQSEPESRRYHDTQRPAISNCSGAHFAEIELGDSGGDGNRQGAIDNITSSSQLPRTPHKHDSEDLSVVGHKSVKIAFDRSPQSERVVGDIETVEELLLPPSSSRQRNGKTMAFSINSNEGSLGWIDGVSRTLAVPSNRALVLDVAGTMTAEAVRSAIDVVVSKVSVSLRGKPKLKDPLSDGKASTSKVVNVINKTGELAQASAAKAMVAMTMCLAICLHTLVGPSRDFT